MSTDTGTDGTTRGSDDLDDLEAKARATRTVKWSSWFSETEFKDEHGIWAVFGAFMAACDPDTVLHLVERVRAGEELAGAGVMLGDAWVESAHSYACCTHQRERDLDQRRQEAQERWDAALARWESLAYPPQEAP